MMNNTEKRVEYKAKVDGEDFIMYGVPAGTEGVLCIHPLAELRGLLPDNLKGLVADYVFIPDVIFGVKNDKKPKAMIPVKRLDAMDVTEAIC